MQLAGARRKELVEPGRWKKFTRRRKFWGWEAVGLLLPGLALFGFFVAQPEAALSNGPALLIDNLLRALAMIAAVGTVTVVLAQDRVAARAAFVASAACVLLGVARPANRTATPFRDGR